MSEIEPTAANITSRYDDDRMQPRSDDVIPWPLVRERIATAEGYWFATVGPGVRPHVRPVLGVWLDGAWCSTSGPATAKSRNLGRNPRCSVATRTDGLDLVLEGTAAPVRDAGTLERIAAAYHQKYGWPVRVEGAAFHAPYGAPTAGGPPYEPYRVTPDVVYALGTDEELAPRTTRYRFG